MLPFGAAVFGRRSTTRGRFVDTLDDARDRRAVEAQRRVQWHYMDSLGQSRAQSIGRGRALGGLGPDARRCRETSHR